MALLLFQSQVVSKLFFMQMVSSFTEFPGRRISLLFRGTLGLGQSLNFQNVITYMMLSRKRFPTTPFHPLMLNGLHRNRVECLNILGYFSPLISYNFAEGDTLKQLYMSLIRPHLEYVCPVWDPHTMKDKTLLENVQKCAFRMATKQWDSGYQDLLDIMNAHSLEDQTPA